MFEQSPDPAGALKPLLPQLRPRVGASPSKAFGIINVVTVLVEDLARIPPAFRLLTHINVRWRRFVGYCYMWQSISTAPCDCDLELAVLDDDGAHALIFPCRRILGG